MKPDPISIAVGLVTSIIRTVVDSESEVTVTATETESCVVLSVLVAKSDVGKVIGSRGDTANAIRTLLKAVGGRYKKKFIMELQE